MVVSSLGDNNNLLYLHPSNSSNTTLISYLLTMRDNYAIWSRAMIFFLDGKNKLGFIEGFVPLSIGPDRANKWNMVNFVVMSWILNYVDKSLYLNLVFYEKASGMWFDLRQTYCKINETRLYGLLQKISRISQGSDSVSTYYMKIKHI